MYYEMIIFKQLPLLPTILSNLEATVVNGNDIGGGLCDGGIEPSLEQKRALGIPLNV